MTTVRGSGPYLRARIDYTVTALTNGAKVSASLYAENCNDAYFQAHAYGTYKLTVNGSVASGSGAALSGSMNGAVKLLDKTVTINYTGNHSNITIKGEIPSIGVMINGTYITARSVSASVALPKVGTAPTKGTITAPGTYILDETYTTIPITWTKGSSYNGSGMYRIDVKINNGAYTFVSGDINFSNSSHPTSWTYTIPSGNRVQGTTFAFQMDTGNDVGWSGHTYSGTVTMNKLSPPAFGTINTYNPYTATKDSGGLSLLNVPISGGSQLMAGKIWRFADLYDGSTWLKTCNDYQGKPTGDGNNTTVTFAYSADSFASRIGTGAYAKTFRLVGWLQNAHGSRSSYIEKTFTVNLNSDGGATPSMASDAVTISGGKTATIFLVGKNSVAVSIASSKCATRRAPSGTSLSYKIECTGKSTFTGNSTSFSGMTAGKKTIKAIVTDSRGLTSSQTKYVYFQPYSDPTATITSATRLDSPNTTATIGYSLGYTSVKNCDANGNLGTTEQNGINSLQYRINGGSWVTVSSPSINGTFNVTGLTAEATHTIQLRVCDKMYTDAGIGSNTVTIPTMNVGLALRKSRIGINCVPQSGEALSVNGYTNLKGNLNITGTATIGGTSTFTGLLTANGDINVPTGRCPVDGGVPRAGSLTNTNGLESFLSNYKTFIGSASASGTWYNVISTRHRNGNGDGNNFGMYIRSLLTSNGSLFYRQQINGSWGSERMIVDNWNYPEATKHYHYRFYCPSGGGARWVHIGDFPSNPGGITHAIRIYSGNGFNGRSDQNSEIEIRIKPAAENYGTTFWVNGYYNNNIQVRVYTQSSSTPCQLWVYFPWAWYSGCVEVYTEGSFSFNGASQTGAPAQPSNTANAPVANITPDMRGYPVGSMMWLEETKNPATLVGGTWHAKKIALTVGTDWNYVLDINTGVVSNNQNVQIYTWNGSGAQRFTTAFGDSNATVANTSRINVVPWLRTA